MAKMIRSLFKFSKYNKLFHYFFENKAINFHSRNSHFASGNFNRIYINPFACSHFVVPVRYKKTQGKLMKGGKSKRVHLTDEELSDVIDIDDYRNRLLQIVNKLKHNYATNVSIRLTAGSIDLLPVTIENEEYPLNELAQISRKNQNLIAINMAGFPEGLKPALQAINESGLGLNPQQEGTMIYIPTPKITREHRENLAKNAKSLFLKAKDEVKHVQNYFVKEAKMKTELSEDLVFNATHQIMSMAENTITEMEKIMKSKQNELINDN